MNSSAHKTNLLLFSLLFLGIAGGCNLLGGDDNGAPPLNWQDGEIIEAGNEDQLTESQRNLYQMDAERLSVRLTRNQDSTETEIPQALIDHLYNGLVHIATSNMPKAREATEEYDIHAQVPAHPRQIEVWSDTTASWVEVWEKGQTQTGNSDVDNLISQYGLELTAYEAMEDTVLSMAVLQSGSPLNGYAVGQLFEEIENIERAAPGIGEDPSEIDVLFYDDRLRYYFQYRFGNCSSDSGCTKAHIWIFDVFKDGEISFIGEQGDPL